MSPQAFFCGVTAIFFLWSIWAWATSGSSIGAACGVLLALISGYFSYQGTRPEHMAEIKAEEKKSQAAELREQTPHVVREADGCKVYAFKSGDRYHFFTRCPNSQTTTESSWKECHRAGKNTTCQIKTESIEATQ